MSVQKSLRIPEPLFAKIEALHAENPKGWQSMHDLMICLLEEGVVAKKLNNTKVQARHMASALADILKEKP